MNLDKLNRLLAEYGSKKRIAYRSPDVGDDPDVIIADPGQAFGLMAAFAQLPIEFMKRLFDVVDRESAVRRLFARYEAGKSENGCMDNTHTLH